MVSGDILRSCAEVDRNNKCHVRKCNIRNSQIRYVTETKPTDSNEEYAFKLTPHSDTTTVIIADEPVDMIIDSGASCNITNCNVAALLRDRGERFEACRRAIHPYASPPIAAHQTVTCDVNIGNQTTRAEFIVLHGNSPPLMGKITAELLGALKVGVNFVSQTSANRIIDKYPGIATGIGSLKNVTVMLHIDKTVTPVARKHCGIPFHRREKVANDMRKLERADVIEKVTGPTEWVSIIVTPRKPKNPDEIRLYVDMREANKAMLRTRHVTPTIDELVSRLQGATVFSKIDRASGMPIHNHILDTHGTVSLQTPEFWHKLSSRSFPACNSDCVG